MAKRSHKAVAGGSDAPVGKKRHSCRSIPAVMRMARSKFGAKASLELALRADADQRSAERWLAGKGLTAENFCSLLKSDLGPDALASVMGDDKAAWPAWYLGMRRQIALSSLRAGLVAQQRAIERLECET
jgi:hypothetical protein